MTIVKPSILPGFLELLPRDQIVFDNLKEIIEKNFKFYGFFPLDTPMIEKKEVLLAKENGETTKQMYEIDSSSKDMVLRFDLTVPLSRYVAEHFHELEFPFRRYQISKVFRGERNQKGRFKEFYQADIDIIGDNSLDIKNDAEIPRVILSILKDMNFDQINFHINNRKLINGFMKSLDIENYDEVLRAIDKVKKMTKENFYSYLLELVKSNEKADSIIEFVSKDLENEEIIDYLNSLEIENEEFVQGLEELKEVYKYMKIFGVDNEYIRIDLSITRGLDYYTGTVYETFIKGFESIGSICSGGRYENLSGNFIERNLPGVGISIGLSRLYYSLNELGLLNNEKNNNIDLIIFSMGVSYEYPIKILNLLRSNNYKAQIYFEDVKFKKKLNYANKLGIPYVIIIGDEELKENKVTFKNMQTGEQFLYSSEELITKLNDIL